MACLGREGKTDEVFTLSVASFNMFFYILLREERVFAAMDGLKLCLEQSASHAIQNAFYNDWKNDHYVSNIFLLMPDGMI
eukprot:10941409-Ditylum_brightwellii.AAC.1